MANANQIAARSDIEALIAKVEETIAMAGAVKQSLQDKGIPVDCPDCQVIVDALSPTIATLQKDAESVYEISEVV